MTLTTAAGDTLAARHALVTLPLGVLKAAAADGSIAFDPPLPAAKAKAVQDMVWGCVCVGGGLRVHELAYNQAMLG